MSHNFRDAPLAALDDQHWRGLPPAKRKQVLIAFAEQILAHREELAWLETVDMGKPIHYARSVDVNSTANCMRWYGEAIDKVYREIAPTAPRRRWPPATAWC